MPRFWLAGNLSGNSASAPGPLNPGPGKAALRAAASLVTERAAALARSREKVTAVGAVLASLQAQAETATERYDQAVATERQAADAYQAAAARLAAARRAQAQSRSRVAVQAAADFEVQGGLGPMAVMLGGAGGPGAFLSALDVEQLLASHRTDTLGADRATSAVASAFSEQAAVLLGQRQADAAEVDADRLAVQAAVDRQVAAMRAARTAQGQAAVLLAIARTNNAKLVAEHRAAVAAQRRAAAAARAARERAARLAARAGDPGGGTSGSWASPPWTTGSGASAAQGVTAADWALTQIGKPYQWGAAGPATYDCSGLAMDAWARAGIQLGHYTGWQWPSGPHIPVSQLRRGDLVFYATDTADPATIHHVGIYIGGGMMVDAPFTGAFVRIDSIYQFPGLSGATRPAN
jgi:cell wall-associated NlpC family hydrolase